MNAHLCLSLSLLLGLASPLFAEDPKLKSLESELDGAMTQMDMNIKSAEIADYLEQKLSKLENLIRKDLDPESRELFDKAAALWRDYVKAQCEFFGDQYRGGSMRPLVHNSAYVRLAKERIESLRELDPERIYKEDASGEWIK